MTRSSWYSLVLVVIALHIGAGSRAQSEASHSSGRIDYELTPEFDALVDSVIIPHARSNGSKPICLLDYHDGTYEFLFMFYEGTNSLLTRLAAHSDRRVAGIPVIFTADIELSNLSHERLPNNVIRSENTLIYGGYLIEYQGGFASGTVVRTSWQR